MEGEKRFNMGPVPARPERYINETQVSGLSVLRKFGWMLVCIRRPALNEITTILKNRHENSLGVLGEDGVLRISQNLRIRSKQVTMEPGEQTQFGDPVLE